MNEDAEYRFGQKCVSGEVDPIFETVIGRS
jgi:hypothetical protein